MPGASIGPYTLEEPLGRGGMGVVWRASVRDDARDACGAAVVAVKVIHPQLAGSPDAVARFVREARLGLAVRHDNVVRTIDAGTADLGAGPAPYLVMEYVEGRTLRALLAESGAMTDGLVREIGRQAADGLAAIHAAGIVHRDVKPDNLLVTPDQRVRIMDLGIARASDASAAITRDGQFAGTLHYAAPEQFRGDAAGPAADLYSLGVTLHEITTGANPFRHTEIGAVVSAHLSHTPPPVADPDVSPFVAEVIRTLLAKDPAERFASAAELRSVLELGEHSAWWTSRERRSAEGRRHHPRVPVRRDAPMAGRETEFALLRDAWDDARAGRGAVVLLEGEAGIGKTRLVDLLLGEVAESDPAAHVLYGSYAPSGGLGAISEALVDRFGASGLEAAIRPYLTATPGLVPAFAAMMRNDVPPAGSAPLSGDAFHAVTCRLMQALAAEYPLLWVVDDVHFASADSRRLLLALARAAGSHRVLLLMTARPGRIPPEELGWFARLPSFRRVPLGRLGPREVVRILAGLLGSESLAERIGPRIAERSDGVPWFVFEIVRALRESGALVRQDDGTFAATGILDLTQPPGNVHELVAARLAELTPVERSLLEAGAVAGFRFDPDLVRRVAGMPRLRALRLLADAERRTGIVRNGAGMCRFDHHQIQEVLYAELTPDLRAEYHALLAETFAEREGLAEVPPDDVPGPAAQFAAMHGLRGSRPGRWAACVPAALRHLEQGFENEAFVDLAEAADAAGVEIPGADRADVLVRKAECLARLGRRTDERAALSEADRVAAVQGRPLARCRTLRALAAHDQVVSEFARSAELAKEALAFARAAGDAPAEVGALQAIGGAHWRLGAADAAGAALDEALAITRRIGDRRLEARVLLSLAALDSDLRSRPAESERQYEEAVAIRRSLGDDLREAALQNNLGWSRIQSGRFAEALAHLDTGISIVRETGARLGETINLTNRGLVLGYLGDSAAARRALADARSLCREIAERRSESYAVHRLGLLAENDGDPDGALAHWDEALAIRRAIRYPRGVAETSLAIARVLLDTGRPDAAAAPLAETAATARSVGIVAFEVLAALLGARIGEVRPADAVALLGGNAGRLDAVQTIEAHAAAWDVTGDPGHLAAARSRLRGLVAAAPPARRAAMLTRVRLFRTVAGDAVVAE